MFTADKMARLNVHIVEDHDDALRHIYRAIGSKKLSFSGIALVHFDSHPDLLSPNLQADDFFDKEKLYAYTSIAEWILPAVYAGHVEAVVWIKAPWANQIAEGTHSLTVGRDISSGHLRVSTPLPYYLSELLYVSEANLENRRTVPLHVITIGINGSIETRPIPNFLLAHQHVVFDVKDDDDDVCKDISSGEGPPALKRVKILPDGDRHGNTGLGKDCTSCTVSETSCTMSETSCTMSETSCTMSETSCTVSETAIEVLKSVLQSCKCWILDIDLDFFSTSNPFKCIFSKEQFDYMSTLYTLRGPQDTSPESIGECVWGRQLQLQSLKCLLSKTCPTQSVMVAKAQSLLGTYDCNGSLIDTESLHLAGMMTDLPHHVSNHEDLINLAASLYHLVLSSTSRDPSLITIARSSEDDYTPCTQVDLIQFYVTCVLEELYVHTKLTYHYHYLGTPEHKQRYSPQHSDDGDYSPA